MLKEDSICFVYIKLKLITLKYFIKKILKDFSVSETLNQSVCTPAITPAELLSQMKEAVVTQNSIYSIVLQAKKLQVYIYLPQPFV